MIRVSASWHAQVPFADNGSTSQHGMGQFEPMRFNIVCPVAIKPAVPAGGPALEISLHVAFTQGIKRRNICRNGLSAKNVATNSGRLCSKCMTTSTHSLRSAAK